MGILYPSSSLVVLTGGFNFKIFEEYFQDTFFTEGYSIHSHPEYLVHPLHLEQEVCDYQEELAQGRKVLVYTQSDLLLQHINNALKRSRLLDKLDTKLPILPFDRAEGFEFFQNEVFPMELSEYGFVCQWMNDYLTKLIDETKKIEDLMDLP